MKDLLIRMGIIVVCAAAGALAIQVLIHWLPNTTTIAGAILAGSVGFLLTRPKK